MAIESMLSFSAASDPVEHRSNTKKALCVAVSYRGSLPEDMQLEKTHEDAKIIQRLLTELYGYRKQDIQLLLDDGDPTTGLEPTRENILRAMEHLVSGAKSGDRFVFHYSGHGSQIENTNGTEADGKDEVIWPSDVEVDDPKDENSPVRNYIIDDDIKKVLVDSLPVGAHMTIIFDCCHSGTAADLPHCHSDHYRESPKTLRNVRGHLSVLPNKSEHLSGYQEYERDVESPISPLSPLDLWDRSGNFAAVVSWSACKDPQITFGTYKGGIFVNLLDYILRHRHGQTDITHEELLHELTISLEKIAGRKAHGASPDTPDFVKPPRPQLATLHDYESVLKIPVRL